MLKRILTIAVGILTACLIIGVVLYSDIGQHHKKSNVTVVD